MPTAAISRGDLDRSLKELFGFDEFRALQRDAVSTALDGRDLLLVMPTGAGKSLCFQLPAALASGVTVVVSPLIALMRDQVAALLARPAFFRLGCSCLNSGQSPEEQREVLRRLRDGQVRLLYVAPERFRSSGFLDVLSSIRLARFVLDEAHCISEWGHDFRPDYLALGPMIESLGRPPITAVTATATARVQQSIVKNLKMRDPAIFIGGFNRPNLHFSVHGSKTEDERLEKIGKALPRLAAAGGSGLIYVMTRKQSEAVAAAVSSVLRPLGRRAAAYHAGMETDRRNAAQVGWLSGDVQVLVATNAFGMGIDKPDVRFVIHFGFPENIEAYYQEAGRAGRDGKRSRCVILHHFSDRRTREWLIENDSVTPSDLCTAHEHLGSEGGEEIKRTPRAWWTQKLGWSETKLRLTLGALERAGVVETLSETADDITLQILHRRFPPGTLEQLAAALEKQKQERYRRLGEMIAYLRTKSCRRKQILDYFGDRAALTPGPSCCDNCARPEPDAAAPAAMSRVPAPPSIDASNSLSLLHGIDALRPALGKKRLVLLLRGSEAKENQSAALTGSPLFGVLRDCSQSRVERFLDELKTNGLLHQADEDNYFVWTVTPRGREAWKKNQPVDVTSPLAAHTTEQAGIAGDLGEALRQWRTRQARAEGVPPFMIFSDRTLQGIVRFSPRSLDELRDISGLGGAKIGRYGEAVLSLVREHAGSKDE